jgi:predicted glycosyltransferase
MGARLLAYSHDGYGLGHFRRNLRLAAGLRRSRPDVEVLLATGASAADRFELATGLRCLKLPALVKVADGHYEPQERGRGYRDVIDARAEELERAVRDFRPDLILADRYPAGLGGELAPALDAFHERAPDRPAVLGLRDILDCPDRVRAEWETHGHAAVIRRHFRTILTYGDRQLYDPVVQYGYPEDIAVKVQFTGYLTDDPGSPRGSAPAARTVTDGKRLAVCTVGGGQDGYPIAEAFMAAMDLLEGQGWAGVMLTGPYMDVESVERLRRRRRDVAVLRMVDDVPRYLGEADVAVTMGGYNTMCEVLSQPVPTVVVPRDHPRLEQLIRVECLARGDLVRPLSLAAMTPDTLADAIRSAAEVSRSDLRARRGQVAGGGVATVAATLAALLPPPPPSTGERGVVLTTSPGGENQHPWIHA